MAAATRSGSLPITSQPTPDHRPRGPAPDWLRRRPIAHRGLCAPGLIENSVQAFAACVQRGIPIELDVQLCGSGEPVVFHDGALGRLTAARGAVADCPLAALRRLALPDGSVVPTFAEVLALVDGRVPLLVELKARGDAAPLADAVIAALAGYGGPVAAQSFDPRTVDHLRRHAPWLPRGQLAGALRDRGDLPWWRRRALAAMAWNLLTRPHFLAYEDKSLGRASLAALRLRAGRRPLLLWTVRDAAAAARAGRIGANIIYEPW